MEKELLQEDSQIILIIIIAIFVLLFMAVALVLFFFFSRKKIIATELEKANLALAHQKKILQATIETQEQERERIAQDLHDAISSKLNVVSLSTNVLIDGNLTDKEQEDTLEHILNITTLTLESSRRLAHNLLPPILDKFGLEAALEELCDEFENSKKVTIQRSIKYLNTFTKTKELHIFRIIQEFINNAIRHGEATQMKLILVSEEDNLCISFEDNGKGFDEEVLEDKVGLGLKNIQSRVDILDGEIDYTSKINKGTKFTIKIGNGEDECWN